MRQVLAVVAAVVVLAGAVGGAYWWLLEGTEGADAEVVDPATTVDRYLDAWAAGDHDAMLELVRDPPETFAADLEQLRDGLGVDRLVVSRAELDEDVDGRASATVEVEAEVADVGPVTWEVTLRLLRERGSWGIAYEPSTLHPSWRPGLAFAVTREAVDREPILARDGAVLAGPTERVTFGFEPAAVTDPSQLADAFEDAVPGTGATVDRLFAQGGLVDGWFYPVTSLPVGEAREARAALTGLAGVVRRSDSSTRGLLADGFAVDVVGRVGEATAEELERLGPPYEAGDIVGRTGLEAALERQLAGGERIRVGLVDGSDRPSGDAFADARVGADGSASSGPATTTLDVAVQRAVENTLLAREDEAAMVVVDAADGAIRAAASRPSPGFDRALQGRYAPGEVFAVVAAEAAIASGDEVGSAVGAETLTAAAERFGFGVEPELPVPAVGGSFPDPGPELAGATRGQARVQVSPLHLATVAAATATGVWHPPALLEDDLGGAPRQLAPGALDGLGRFLADSTPEQVTVDGVAGLAGTAAGQGVTHVWFVGTVVDGDDRLGVAIVVEDAGDDPDADVIGGGLADRLVRELRAVRDAPVDRDVGADEDASDDDPDATADDDADLG